MNRTLPRVTLFSVIIAVLAAGCASTGGDVKYVDAGSTRTLVSLDKLNLQDLNQAAEAMITSLRENFINAGKLSGTGPNGLAVLKIERIINDTSEQWDSDLLTKKIRIDLNRTGKVATSTTFGNDAESKIGQELAQERQFLNKGGGVLNPDYTLTGKVIEDTNRNGNKREKVYFFHLALTDMRNGLAIWEEEKAIVKQGSRSSVGW
jgi:uncharacterized protein (TIGR02722 family)